ncbi:response regulator [Cohnella zeiphila]|uniref:Response regulator n=1 Tax=Cohnella zeiphila TaxID=2761120 RepID=A0A7X0SS86_9BACL|nr:response regulator [Cohnella zeiphila]MBB6735139.1 response regulator [Cohnella zeiphila]
MKRKLVIADDELNIRHGLRAMIERRYPDSYEFAFAENGSEALSLIAEGGVHFLLTDIRMPVMDGIELLERLQELPEKPAVVILSGYDDFPYAKAAIRYQAKEYLLKPIVRDELFSVLERLADEWRLQEERGQGEADRQGIERSERLAYVLRQASIGEEEVRRLLGEAGLDWLDGGYAVGLLKTGEQASDAWAATSRLEQWLSGEERWARCSLREREHIVVVRGADRFRLLLNPPEGSAQEPLSIAVSSEAKGAGQLRLAYSQARQAAKYFLLNDGPGLIGYDRIRALDSGCPLPAEQIRKISNLLGVGRLPQIKRLLQETLDIRVVSRCEIGYLQQISRLLNEEVFDRVFRTYGEESVEVLKLYKKAGHIENFARFHDYYFHVEQLLERLDEYVGRVRSAHAEHKDMQRAVEYLQEHYREDVNMAVVSNYISLNYTYFSEAFKEYTGESFSAYLRKLRLGKAKELLAGTDLKVYEVCSLVGFDNVKHFTRVFKEAEGITPLEYRSKEAERA